MLAQAPAPPRTFEEWLQLPRATDAFTRDQFGFRLNLIKANARIRKQFGEQSQSAVSTVVQGREGFMLYRDGLLKSFGIDISTDSIAHSTAVICEIHERLRRQNIEFVYAIAPATTTIYPEAAPQWLGSPHLTTNYDLLLRSVSACGAQTIDLRPALLAEKTEHLLYRRTDTHWTPRGALIAYNVIVAGIHRPELHIDPEQIPWRRARAEGDLTRMSGAIDAPPEIFEAPDLPDIRPSLEQRLSPAFLDMHSFIRDYPRSGASVLVIGDSFAYSFFFDFLAQGARRTSFIHHRNCSFNWSDIERSSPDIVIYMPTERLAPCPERNNPENFTQ